MVSFLNSFYRGLYSAAKKGLVYDISRFIELTNEALFRHKTDSIYNHINVKGCMSKGG